MKKFLPTLNEKGNNAFREKSMQGNIAKSYILLNLNIKTLRNRTQ